MDKLPHPLRMKRAYGLQWVQQPSGLEPIITVWENGERKVFDGEEAKRFVTRERRTEGAARIIFFPLALAWRALMAIHNGIEWLYCKVAGER